MPGESAKAFTAFKIYRDLGVERSLVKASEYYYGSTANLAQTKVWSAKFDWVERVRAYDDWLSLRDSAVIEEYQASKAQEVAARQHALREKLLTNAEKAADQAAKMLEWPLTEQRVTREGEDGENITYVFLPAGWSKATIRGLHEMAASAVIGNWTNKDIEDEELETFDFSGWTDEEISEYIRLTEKLGVRKRPRG